MDAIGSSPDYPSSRRTDFAAIGFCALVYFLAHQLSFYFPDSQKILMAVWPAGGIGLAALLLSPRRLWPSLFATLFVSGVCVEWIVFMAIWLVASNVAFQPHNPLHPLMSITPFMLIGLLSWPALRFGIRSVSIALILLAGVAVTSRAVDAGPLTWGGSTESVRLLSVQLYLAFLTVTAFLLTASMRKPFSRADLESILEKYLKKS